MKNLVYIVGIVLLAVGLAMMFMNLPFESKLPVWTDKAAIGAGIVLNLLAFVSGSRKAA